MKRMIFDVESIGLHGEGFAVGFVILDDDKVVDEAWGMCDSRKAAGSDEGRHWIKEHCPWSETGLTGKERERYGFPPGRVFQSAVEVREWFWSRWLDFKGSHSAVELWADVAWPVEARFLIACVEDARAETRPARGRGRNINLERTPREFAGPFPLMDVDTLAQAVIKLDPDLGACLASPVLAHHPLSDARESAQKLLWAEAALKVRA